MADTQTQTKSTQTRRAGWIVMSVLIWDETHPAINTEGAYNDQEKARAEMRSMTKDQYTMEIDEETPDTIRMYDETNDATLLLRVVEVPEGE